MYHTQVLTNWQAEHVVICRQCKPELPSVVSNDLCGGEQGSGVTALPQAPNTPRAEQHTTDTNCYKVQH